MNSLNNIKVYCRFRALEDSSDCRYIKCNFLNSRELEIIPSKDEESTLKFEFDHIFHPNSNQEEVFKFAAKSLVEDVAQGFNGTILAYGQTASGKTYTITGTDIFDPTSMGIVPRMISTLFDLIEISEGSIEFSIRVSYCELYLEKIVDLTDIDKKSLKLRESKKDGFYIQGLSEHYVSSDFDVFEILRIGTENKHLMCTNMNTRSSRSHTVFTLSINIHNAVNSSIRTGKMVIVDLAGSERVSKTGAEGLRLKELKNINKSLNALTSVINALNDNKAQHVPYRDSKLTKILSNSLGGNAKTAMIINCSSLILNENETITTLRFGAIAKCVQNKPKINRELTLAELKLKLQKIEEELKRKAIKIMALEEILSKLNIPIEFLDTVTEKNEVIDTAVTDNDEYLIELEELSDKLNEYIEDNSKKKRTINEIKADCDELEGKKLNDHGLISVIEEKHSKIELAIRNKAALVHKSEIEKNVLSEKIEKSQSRKIDLERTLIEKTAELADFLQLAKARENSDNPPNASESIEELKDHLITEQNRYKTNQNILQDLQIRLNLALQEQLSHKNTEEKSNLLREVTVRENRLTELEAELETVQDSNRLIKKILTQDEPTLNIDTEELESKLKELSEVYKQLVARQSSSNIEKQINNRRVMRLNDRISGLEKDLQIKHEELLKVKNEANKILDDIANQSIFNKIRVPIKGGGGKNNRNQTLSRLSFKPRLYASMKFN